ncbi:hypothetical protein RHABOEDO_000517 [Candidatus Rhabdochlamydia oedothoracis]|uniref:Uncharacterized protein n=1 Tax=Candidatus Rhabdochlamydia oedothoracis TaxID=2720720 RepID=A0ABX8V5Q4_9BACT|nr:MULTISPECIES: hypothetical protein [Rhabdochlamydia]KAG6558572.1 hypothetical protein RHOW815_001439 [Candidatus Rhabdochlamydia sp. W815]MCL6756699.1 hypothetical protein [Candidatus Rhabdochlamydia oedothoracis]QYF48370.1 hypothetical protein RHABOEDO_000517 [Candidatus Rhabdochlamydia oedothoracis]
MESYFCKSIFDPRAVALTAVGGCIAGRFCGISPMHGAIYAVTSRSVGTVAAIIHIGLFTRSVRLMNSFSKFLVTPLLMTRAYLVFTAGNKALSLIGKPLIFTTAVKVSLILGITSFFSDLLINYIKDRAFKN